MARFSASLGVLATIIALGSCFVLSKMCNAQETFPHTFIELLKVGSRVGVNAIKNDGPEVHFLFYADEQEAIVKDSFVLSTEDLSNKYPEVKKLVEKKLAAAISQSNNKLRLADIHRLAYANCRQPSVGVAASATGPLSYLPNAVPVKSRQDSQFRSAD